MATILKRYSAFMHWEFRDYREPIDAGIAITIYILIALFRCYACNEK
jgi:hypothetical protein